MEKKVKKVANFFGVLFAILLVAQTVSSAQYNISASYDWTGVFAVTMPSVALPGKVFFPWWNETKGKELGIELKEKGYDNKYDPSVMASIWPGIVAGDKPIAHNGMGAIDAMVLWKRLPDDKIPLIGQTTVYGFLWLPNTWVFYPRPSYAHEAAGFFNWVHLNKIKDRPIKVGLINMKVSAGFVDQVDGFKAFAIKYPWVEIVGIEWIPPKPISLVTEVRRLSKEKPDFLWIPSTTTHVITTLKAQRELGIHIPVVMASHNGIKMCALDSKDITVLEGNYDTAAMDTSLDPNVPGARLVDEYCKKLKLEKLWDLTVVQTSIMKLLTVRAVERAAAMVGPDKITGETIYNAMFQKPFTEEELLGLAPTLTFTKQDPFSIKNLKGKATMVKDGKHVQVTDDWIPIPDIPNWGAKKDK